MSAAIPFPFGDPSFRPGPKFSGSYAGRRGVTVIRDCLHWVDWGDGHGLWYATALPNLLLYSGPSDPSQPAIGSPRTLGRTPIVNAWVPLDPGADARVPPDPLTNTGSF